MSELVYRRGKSKNWYSRKTRLSTGTADKARAEAFVAQEIRAAWDKTRLGIVPEKTWDEACLSWTEEVGQYLRSGANQAYIAQTMTAYFRGMYLSEITKELMHKIMLPRITKEPSPQNNTANQYIAFAAKIIRHAGVMPPKFVRYPTPGGKDRYLTVEEWQTLSVVMDPDFRQICTFALATGLRRSNVMGLRWDWVKGDVLTIPQEFTKTVKPYVLPLNQTALGILEERRNNPVRSLEIAFLVNGKPVSETMVGTLMGRAVEASRVAPITFHGYRHTFASWLTQREVPWEIVARLGCWKLTGMVKFC